MEVILLERVAKLGHMGETVRVKDGYARNFLLPRGKALRATENNKKKFEETAPRAREAQSRDDARRRDQIRQVRRAILHHHSPGGRDRPALRLSLRPRRRRRDRSDGGSRSIATTSRSTRRSRRSGMHKIPCTASRSRGAVTVNVARGRGGRALARGEDVTARRDHG